MRKRGQTMVEIEREGEKERERDRESAAERVIESRARSLLYRPPYAYPVPSIASNPLFSVSLCRRSAPLSRNQPTTFELYLSALHSTLPSHSDESFVFFAQRSPTLVSKRTNEKHRLAIGSG